jgi:cellulose synthase/poly-beta-1,6-N-acetylglucosamine synthase-like glycosyltransferase
MFHAKHIGILVDEWTPFLLVSSYFVVSTGIYVICTPKLIEVFWFIYLCTSFYIAGNSVVEAFLSLSATRDSRRAVSSTGARNWKFSTQDDQLLLLDLVIVAYLPNEKDIIVDRVHYALEEIQYPQDKFTINVVYNTPKTVDPTETELKDLASEQANLFIFKAPGSTSKAQNLNYFLSLRRQSDVIGILDCDHYAHPYGPRWAIERFLQDKETDVVQGRCVVFNPQSSFINSMISVEFDKMYAVSHPGRSIMWGFGLFTGSNAYWRTSLLRDIKMDDTMLTEDIDASLRSLSQGAKIVHDLNVISYELSPVSLASLWNQRLRWAQGWAQASIKHMTLFCKRQPVRSRWNKKLRFGIVTLLLIREISYYLVSQYCCLVLSLIITQFPTTGSSVAKLLFFQYPVSEWLLITRFAELSLWDISHQLIHSLFSIGATLFTLLVTSRARSEFISIWMILEFSLLYPVYVIICAVLGLYGHARMVAKYSSWKVTARG